MPADKKKKVKTPPIPEDPAYTPPTYGPAAGKRALDALGPELDAIAEAQLVTAKVDVETATYAALGVVGFVSSAGVRARFARLPVEEFDIAHIDCLEPTCFATLYAIAEARIAGALENNARLPTTLIAEASEVEARMQTVCEYLLGDDRTIKPELDRLRPGTGHRDLANDLLGYARIYDMRADVVKSDQKHYRAGDAARALELAGAIIQKLSADMTPRARAAYDRYIRVWTLLNHRYDEVRSAGLWLFRKDLHVDERFPSLFAAARPNGGRPRKVAPKEAGGESSAPSAAAGSEASPA
jgi:hypothetical protein